jgi:hypothetical protein
VEEVEALDGVTKDADAPNCGACSAYHGANMFGLVDVLGPFDGAANEVRIAAAGGENHQFSFAWVGCQAIVV